MLTTVQQIIDYLIGIGETVPEGHRQLIEFLIKRLSEAVERFCRRKFAQQTYTAELHTGESGQTMLRPHQFPIGTITTVTLDGTAITEGTGSTNYRKVKNTDGDVVALYRKDGWKSEPYGVSLTYQAGYILPEVTNRDLPYDLEGALVELVAGAYLQRGKAGLTRESFEGLSLDFDRWPAHVLHTLRKYQRPVM